MFSDASEIACGSYVVKAINSGFHSNCSEEEKVKSSRLGNYRQLVLTLQF